MVNLNYADYSYDNLVAQMQNIIKYKGTWVDTYESGTGKTLIELWCYIAELMMYYAERRAQESFIDTAQFRSSVINLTKLINYRPKRNVSGQGNVEFSLFDSGLITWPNDIFIPKYTQLQSNAGRTYLTNEDAIITAGASQLTVQTIQGLIVEQGATATGLINQQVLINDMAVENTNLWVYVDSVLWTEVTSFVQSQGTSQHYRVDYNLDGTVTISFGDNKFGKAPGNGLPILIRYIRSEGLSGNVYSDTGVIITILDTIYDSVGIPVDKIVVDNITKFLNGDDFESSDEIRYEAPRVFKTGDRAVTKEDHMALLDNYPGIETSNVWGEAEESPPNYTMFNRINLSLILHNWVLADVTFQNAVIAFLRTKCPLTIKYSFVDPSIVEIIAVDTAKINRDTSLLVARAAIESVLEDFFTLGQIDMGTAVRYSDVVRAVDEATGVNYHSLKLFVKAQAGVGDGSTTNFTYTLPLLQVDLNTVTVYQNTTEVAEDDGNGNLVAFSGSGVTGTIDYITGIVSIDFSVAPVPGDMVYVKYKQRYSSSEPDDLVVGNNGLVKLVTKTVVVAY